MLQSRNHPPSAALAPFVRRHYVFRATLPDGFEVVDQLLSETAFLRFLVAGDWAAQMPDGSWAQFGPSLLIGSNSRPMPVRVRGAFLVIGVSIRPSGWASLFEQPASEFVDRIVSLEDIWGERARQVFDAISPIGEQDEQVVAIMEAALASRIAELGNVPALDSMLAFEEIARNDCTVRVADIAEQLGLSVRQLERQCHASFGHAPKTVLRRSRFLDMAQAMRGFGTPSVEYLAALRYSDQSHRNREFRHFFGMTAGAFEKAVTPLFTAGLKLRSEGVY